MNVSNVSLIETRDVKTSTEILKSSSSEPLDAEEEAVLAHLIRRKLNNSSDDFFECESGGGKKNRFLRVPKCEKESCDAAPSTLRQRNRRLESFIEALSGPSRDAVTTQQASSLKKIPAPQKKTILKKAGINDSSKMDHKTVLALKEKTDLSWKQLRELKRFMKEFDFKMENEKMSRDLAKELTVPIESDARVFFDKDGEEEQIPFARVGITPLVIKMLDTYDAMDLLTWHEGAIPADEIWIKFGGDHGKGSMKFCIQVLNVSKPNSKKNTFVVGFAEVKDSYENLKVCMDIFKKDLDELQNTVWKNRTIKLYLFRDYEFLTKMYGLSGAAGKHPCLWCLTSKTNMKASASCDEARSLKMIETSHRRFQNYGRGKKEIVGRYYNCLNKPLVSTELDHVAPPYLHLLLGIVLRHHRLLEAAADAVDAMLAQQSEDDAYGEGESVRRFGSNWKQAEQLKKQEMDLYGMLVLEGDGAHLMEEDEKIECIEDLKDAQDALDDLERGDKLGEREGPVCSKFDNILSKNRITPQAYHSRSFVGNHCHKYLTKKVFEELTASAVETTYACTKNITIREEAERMQRKFNTLNEAFAFVHESVSHCQPIKSEDISTIRGQILNYTSISVS